MQTAISDFSGEIIATITGSGSASTRRVVIRFQHLVAKSRSTIYLFKTTHNGSLEIMKSSARSEITADNQLYSLEGAEYTVCKSGTSEAVCVIRTDKKGYGKGRKSAGGFL